MTETEIEKLAETLIQRSTERARVRWNDPQALAAMVAIAVVLVSAVSGYASTQERLEATVTMVEEVRDDVRAMRGEVSGIDALEVRIQHLERNP
jgi:hypothetical protein